MPFKMVWRDRRLFVPYTFRSGPVPGIHRRRARYRCNAWHDREATGSGYACVWYGKGKANKRIGAKMLRARARRELRREVADASA